MFQVWVEFDYENPASLEAVLKHWVTAPSHALFETFMFSFVIGMKILQDGMKSNVERVFQADYYKTKRSYNNYQFSNTYEFAPPLPELVFELARNWQLFYAWILREMRVDDVATTQK